MNKTKKKHLFSRLLLSSVSALSLITSALGGTLGTSVTRLNDDKVGLIQEMTLKLTDLAITMTDATTSGTHGTADLYTFAEGGVLILAAQADCTFAESGGITDTAAVLFALGSAAVGTDNAALTSTEANIIPSTSCTMTAAAGSFEGMSTAAAWLAGHATAAKVRLNVVAADADSASNSAITVNGTVKVWFIHLGDYA